MNKFILSITVLLMTLSLCAQDDTKYTINGYVKDATNGETLIGATAVVKGTVRGVATNEYGFYSLSLEPGSYEIVYESLGFEPVIKTINLTENLKMDVELGEDSEILEEIVVLGEAEDKNVTELEMSVNKLDISTIKKMPTLLGEVEIIRSIQLLPGVSTVGEGATGFNVRGGSIDQNLVLLDEAPVYNSSHLFGFFSVFNPDAVKDVKLYKGGIPSRYGGRLSSILDVRMKEGNSKKLNVNGGVGLIFSRLSIEAPIAKDKASFIIAGRRSYIDVLAKPFLDDDLGDIALNFYDLTLKTNLNINEKNRIFLSGYFGRDNFGFGADAGFNWGNATGTFRWNHLFSEKLFSNATFYYSDYDYELAFGDDSTNSFNWNAGITNLAFKPEFTYFLNPENVVRFGGQTILYTFAPGNAVGISEGETSDISLPEQTAMESGIYIENEQTLGNFKLNYGLRLSHFNYMGEGNAYEFGDAPAGQRRAVTNVTPYDNWKSIQTYMNLEPRLSLKYQVSKKSSLKASYMRTTQYIHLVSNTTAATPIDVWTPSTNNIKPSLADQVAIGYFQNFANNTYELSLETYYKKMDRLVDYVDGADLLLNEFLEGDLLEGQGRAYGLEMQLKKEKGTFTGWLSYTLARTERQVDGISGSEWYPSRFDQTHNISLTGFYELNKRLSASANFTYVTGSPISFPNSRYENGPYVIPHNTINSRNNARIPDYHRLDLGLTLLGKEKKNKRWSDEWVLSIYNVYNRRNAFSIFLRQQQERALAGEQVVTEAIQFSVIGSIIPSISYNFKFK